MQNYILVRILIEIKLKKYHNAQSFSTNKLFLLCLLHHILFFKLDFVYAITAVLIFLCPPPAPQQLPQALSTPLATPTGLAGKFSGHCFLFCSVHPHDCSVTTNMYLLKLSPFSSIYPTSIPCSNHQNVLCIYDCVLLVRFLDSIIDRYVFIAILLFTFFILFFFLKKTL